jgi:cyclophilin family peptidyl-prolyl cis-trans isomerase
MPLTTQPPAMPALSLEPWVISGGSAAGSEGFSDLAFTSSGQLLVAGYRTSTAPGRSDSDQHLSLRDLRGRVIWQWNGGLTGDDGFLATVPWGSGFLAAGYQSAAGGGHRDAYLALFNASGDRTDSFTQASSTATDDQFNDIAITPGGQIVLVGVTRGNGSINGVTKANAAPSGSDRGLGDGLLTILAGSSITRLIGGAGDDGLEAVAVVPSGSAAGTILVAGYQSGSNGDQQAYLAAYDGSGTRLWERSFGSASAADRLTALVCDASTLYVAGTSRGLLPGVTSSRDASRLDADVVLAAFDLNGQPLWVRQLSTSLREETNPRLSLANGRLELVYGDGADLQLASYNTAGQELATASIGRGNGGVELPGAVINDSQGRLVVAGSSSSTWPDRPSGDGFTGLLQFSGSGLSAYQIAIQPLDAQGQPTSTSFQLNPGSNRRFQAGTHAALTGRLSIDAAGNAVYTPYAELPELHAWSATLPDTVNLPLTDLTGAAAGSQELVLLVAAAPAATPLQSFNLSANRVIAQVRPIGLARPQLNLSLSDTTTTTSLGASRNLSAFPGSSAAVSLRLAVERAPLTALNALRYARETLYDRTVFHRVIDGFMVQGGGFSADQLSSSGFGATTSFGAIPLEGTLSSGLSNQRGTIAMARTNQPHSATNQFFVNLVNNAFLNDTAATAADPSGTPGYAVFGAVSSGLEVFDAIAKAPLRNGASGGNDSGWGAQNSGALFEDITEPVVVIEQARLQASPDQRLYALVQQPSFGTVSLDPQSGAFTYQPSEAYAGSDSFEVSATSPALAGLPERTVVQRIAVLGDAGRATHSLANRADGSHLLLNDPAVVYAAVTSNGSPDLIEARTPLSLTLNARSSQTWEASYAAWNAGSPGSAGTGQRLNLQGLARYAFVAQAIPAATTTLNLEPDKDSAFFLHDAYSAFHADLSLSPDSSGRPSSQRLLQIDTIRMGSGGGTSIVDLTSPDYAGTAMTVLGASRGTSVFWGTAADDTFRSGGGDTVIFGGAGANGYALGAGIDTLQYRAGSGARDRLSGFDPSRDRLELWAGAGQAIPEPGFSSGAGSTVIEWGGNRLEFLGLPDLTRSQLQISTALASA